MCNCGLDYIHMALLVCKRACACGGGCVWPDPPDFQNHRCNLLHGWMDEVREEGWKTVQEKLITEQKVLGSEACSDFLLTVSFSASDRRKRGHFLSDKPLRDGWSPSPGTFTFIKICCSIGQPALCSYFCSRKGEIQSVDSEKAKDVLRGRDFGCWTYSDS